ncbi:MAG: putative HTH domain antitoxin [Polyangiales bacterium]|jgi:predicted HTH domain antitoxin
MTDWRLTESDLLPDARDGLTRAERIILWQLYEAQKEFGERNVPTATLYGRVVEHINLSVGAFQKLLQRLVGAPHNTSRIEPS